jgi:hypothetical protein
MFSQNAQECCKVIQDHLQWRVLHSVDEIVKQDLGSLLELPKDKLQKFVESFPVVEQG